MGGPHASLHLRVAYRSVQSWSEACKKNEDKGCINHRFILSSLPSVQPNVGGRELRRPHPSCTANFLSKRKRARICLRCAAFYFLSEPSATPISGFLFSLEGNAGMLEWWNAEMLEC